MTHFAQHDDNYTKVTTFTSHFHLSASSSVTSGKLRWIRGHRGWWESERATRTGDRSHARERERKEWNGREKCFDQSVTLFNCVYRNKRDLLSRRVRVLTSTYTAVATVAVRMWLMEEKKQRKVFATKCLLLLRRGRGKMERNEMLHGDKMKQFKLRWRVPWTTRKGRSFVST